MDAPETPNAAVRPETLGRTNREFPNVWLSLSVPHGGFAEGERERFIGAAKDSGLPIDISSQPALWGSGSGRDGGGLRGGNETLMAFGGRYLETAPNEDIATNLTQSHLIETLSALGRETLDIYTLVIRRPLEEFAINGALTALEDARQEGHIRYFGLYGEGSGLSALGFWQFHDFAELLFTPRNPIRHEAYDTLAPLASDRRVGVVTTNPLSWDYGLPAGVFSREVSEAEANRAVLEDALQTHPILLGVRTVAEIEAAAQLRPQDRFREIADLAGGYRDPAMLRRLAEDSRPWIAHGANRALAALEGAAHPL